MVATGTKAVVLPLLQLVIWRCYNFCGKAAVLGIARPVSGLPPSVIGRCLSGLSQMAALSATPPRVLSLWLELAILRFSVG